MEASISASNILSSIRDVGIVPRGNSRNCVPGENDHLSQDKVHCNYFHPDIPEHPETNFDWVNRQAPGEARIANQLHSLVYQHQSGIYPVVLEKFPGKSFKTNEEYLKELAERVQNSVCLILRKDAFENKKQMSFFRYGDTEEYYDMPTHEEYRCQGSIPPTYIQFVLAPLHLVALAKQFFGEKVIPVADCKANTALGLMHDKAPMMRSYGQEGRVSLIAPDYFEALKALQSNLPELKEGFFTHIVRLPGAPELQKQAGEKKFLFTIAMDQQDKISRIASSPLFKVRRCCDPHEIKYHVVCKEGDLAALKEMFGNKA